MAAVHKTLLNGTVQKIALGIVMLILTVAITRVPLSIGELKDSMQTSLDRQRAATDALGKEFSEFRGAFNEFRGAAVEALGSRKDDIARLSNQLGRIEERIRELERAR